MACNKHKEQRNEMIASLRDEVRQAVKSDNPDMDNIFLLSASVAKMSIDALADAIHSVAKFAHAAGVDGKPFSQLSDEFGEFTESNSNLIAMAKSQEVMVNVLITFGNAAVKKTLTEAGMPEGMINSIVDDSMKEFHESTKPHASTKKTTLNDLGSVDRSQN